MAGVLKKAGGEIPSGFSKCGPFSFATETHLTAFGDNSSTTYTAVIHVPSYAFAISADLPSFGDDCPATNTIFHGQSVVLVYLSRTSAELKLLPSPHPMPITTSPLPEADNIAESEIE